MIPAILSCIFVIYLYRTLNASKELESSEIKRPSLQSLQAKIDALETRLTRLAETNGGTDR